MPKKKKVVPDPYKALGLPHSASDSEIKKAYHLTAKKYHPDRLSSKPDDEKAKGSAIFAAAAAAWEILGDENRKLIYDRDYRLGDVVETAEERDKIAKTKPTTTTTQTAAPSTTRKKPKPAATTTQTTTKNNNNNQKKKPKQQPESSDDDSSSGSGSSSSDSDSGGEARAPRRRTSSGVHMRTTTHSNSMDHSSHSTASVRSSYSNPNLGERTRVQRPAVATNGMSSSTNHRRSINNTNKAPQSKYRAPSSYSTSSSSYGDSSYSNMHKPKKEFLSSDTSGLGGGSTHGTSTFGGPGNQKKKAVRRFSFPSNFSAASSSDDADNKDKQKKNKKTNADNSQQRKGLFSSSNHQRTVDTSYSGPVQRKHRKEVIHRPSNNDKNNGKNNKIKSTEGKRRGWFGRSKSSATDRGHSVEPKTRTIRTSTSTITISRPSQQ